MMLYHEADPECQLPVICECCGDEPAEYYTGGMFGQSLCIYCLREHGEEGNE